MLNPQRLPAKVERIWGKKVQFSGEFLHKGGIGGTTDTKEVIGRTYEGEYVNFSDLLSKIANYDPMSGPTGAFPDDRHKLIVFEHLLGAALMLSSKSGVATWALTLANDARIQMNGGTRIELTEQARIIMDMVGRLRLLGGSEINVYDGVKFSSHGNGGWCGLNGNFDLNTPVPTIPEGAMFSLDGDSRVYRISSLGNSIRAIVDATNQHKFKPGDIFYFVSAAGNNDTNLEYYNAQKGMNVTDIVPSGTTLALMFLSFGTSSFADVPSFSRVV